MFSQLKIVADFIDVSSQLKSLVWKQMLILMTLQHRTSRVKSIGMVSDATTIMRIWLAMEALMEGIAQADEDDEVRQE